MNKGFLVLEDGRVLTGQTSLSRNAFGRVVLDGSTAKLQANTEDFAFTLDQAHINLDSALIGKIVVDSLPIEYHMYDVKNAVL